MLASETHFLLAVVVNGMSSIMIVVAGGVNIVVIAVSSEM